MTNTQQRRELIRLVNSGLPIAAAAKKVGVSESSGRRWVQRLRTGRDSQQLFEERQRNRALGPTMRNAVLADVDWIYDHLWRKGMDAPSAREAEAASVRMTPTVVAALEKQFAADGIPITFESATHHARLAEVGVEFYGG